MRPLRHGLSWAAALTLLASLCCCSPADETERPQQAGKDVPLRVCQTVEPGATRAADGINNTYFGSGERLTVAVGGTAYPFQAADGIGGLACTGSPQPFFPASGGTVTVTACYPAAVPYANTPQPFTVAADQSSEAGYKASDLMHGEPVGGNPVARTASAVPLRFHHKMAKVRVRVAANGITVKAVRLVGIRRRIPFNPSTGTLGEAEEAAGETTVTLYTHPSGTAANLTCAALIPPQGIVAGEAFVAVSTNLGERTYKLPASVTLRAGSEYTYGVTLAGRPKLPIEYVAPYNMMTATEMAPDNHAMNSAYFYWGANDTTLSPEMQAFKNGAVLSGYHLPSIEEWMAIIPPWFTTANLYSGITALDIDGSKNGQRIYSKSGQHLNMGERVAWGVTNDSGIYTYDVRQKFYNDYDNSSSMPLLAYALRFREKEGTTYRNGRYTCAYRYEYVTATGDIGCSSLRIQVKYVGEDQTVGINTVNKEDWWAVPEFTVILPMLGYHEVQGKNLAAGAYSTAYNPNGGFYWSETPYSGITSFNVYVSNGAFYGNYQSHMVKSCLSVRLFCDR